MREFAAMDWFTITGRGDIATTEVPLDESLPELGTDIRIDGIVYRLTGIETHPAWGRTKPVGLLIRGKRKESTS